MPEKYLLQTIFHLQEHPSDRAKVIEQTVLVNNKPVKKAIKFGTYLPNTKTEIEIMRYLKHPNLVSYDTHYSTGNSFFIVMERMDMDAQDYFVKMKQSPEISFAKRQQMYTYILLGAARGINYLHKHNIIHR